MTTTITPGTDFRAFFAMPITAASIDLSNASIIECINKKIEIRRRTSPRFGKGLFSLIKSLLTLQNEYGCIIYPAQINEVFWSLYVPYLEGHNYKSSTIRTLISQLKAVVEWSSHYRARIDPTYNMVNLPEDNTAHISLTPDDVSRIYHYPVHLVAARPQLRKTLERTRDMFCLMCNLGLRYSDAIRLTPEHITDNTISILQQKTKRIAVVNIDRLSIHKNMTMDILKKYNYYAPTTTDCSNFDKYLHQLMTLCAFNDKVHFERVINGNVVISNHAKKDVITSHTARRTFVVNNTLKGVPILEIMRGTGHKTYAAFQKYLCYF